MATSENPDSPPLDLNVDVHSLPWPDGSLKLFKEGSASPDTAWIHPTARDWHQYAFGYQAAYEKLFESWDTSKFRPDSLIYPIAFLCRHYVELRLKELIQMCYSLLDLPKDWRYNHRIDYLWKKVRPHLQTIWPEGPQTELDYVEALIMEFSAMDDASMAFRYPVDNGGAKHLPTVQQVDVVNLRRAMAQLAAFLDGACQGASVYLEHKNDSMSW